MFQAKSLYPLIAIFKDIFRLARRPWKSIGLLYGISLYRNAGYLMANSGFTAILGIVFWIVATRFYSEEEIGIGSALISAGMLLSFIGNLGLGFGIIRFLPYSNDKVRLLNSSFIISFIASIVAGSIFLVGLSLWSPKLLFVRENLVYFIFFIFFIAAGALNTVLNQTFMGFRRSGFALITGIIFNITRIICLAAFISLGKAFNIFASWGIGMMAAMFVCLLLFMPQILPGFRPFILKSNKSEGVSKRMSLISRNKEIFRFSFANYIGQLMQSAPAWILPIMVLNLKGAQANAHFYIVWTIASVLLNIAIMTSMSLFAEGSNVSEKMKTDLKKSLKLITVLTIPAVLVILLIGDKFLLFFGRDYSDAGTHLLWILALSTLPSGINFLYLGVARVEKKLKTIMVISGILAFGSLITSYLFLSWFDIVGVGIGWILTQSVVALVCLPRLLKRL